MGKTNLEVQPAFLATKERLPDRLLFTGKVCGESAREGYLFYLFEILSPWSKVSKIKKIVTDTLERSTQIGDFSEDLFEKILSQINDKLNKLAEAGENEWVGNLNAVLGMVHDGQLLIAQSGKISGYIFRNGKISSLTDSSASGQQNHLITFSDIISGDLRADDRIVFGNGELYNQLSLDKIRRITEKLSSRESTLELYRELKKFKINNVNTIILETKESSAVEEDVLSEIPEVIYLDQVKDSLLKIARKRLDPTLKKYFEKSKKYYGLAKVAAKEKGKVLFTKTKIYAGTVQSKIADKRKNARGQRGDGNTGPEISKLSSNENYKKLKIKTTTYTHKTRTGFEKSFSALSSLITNIWRFLSLKENRKYLYLALIVIFVFGGYLKIRANNINREAISQERAIANSYDQANDLYAKAKENLALGKTSDTKELEAALELALKGEQSPDNKEKSAALVKEIHVSIDKINKITRLYDQTPIFKLGDNISKFALSGYDIYGVNNEGKIYYGNTQDKQIKLFASIGKDNGATKDITLDENDNRVLVVTDNNKMMGLDLTSKTTSEITISDGSIWENATALDIFTSNVYLLDKDKNSVAKHVKDGAGYAKGTTYIDSKKSGLKDAIDLAIDGNIYVLNGDGKMIKLSRGTVDTNFALSGIPGTDATSLKAVFTNANTNYIYVLDSKGNKIIRFDKNGQFVKQYAIDGVEINDFSINDKIKKGYILSSGSVYEFDL